MSVKIRTFDSIFLEEKFQCFFPHTQFQRNKKTWHSSGCPFFGVFCFFFKYKIPRKILSPPPKKIPTKTAPSRFAKKPGRGRPVESNEVSVAPLGNGSVGQDVSLAPYKGDSILIGNYAQTFPWCFKKEGKGESKKVGKYIDVRRKVVYDDQLGEPGAHFFYM